MSYGTGPGQPPYVNGGHGLQPNTGGYYAPFPAQSPYPGPGGFVPPPPPPPQPASKGVAAASIIAAILNGLATLPLIFGLGIVGVVGVAGVVLGAVGYSTNERNPKGAKLMMILSWVIFGLIMLAYVIVIIGLVTFLATYSDPVPTD